MKGIIIGTDLLESGDSVKVLEINTNTTIYNQGADVLDYDAFFSVLTENSITELHFIWTQGDAYFPVAEATFRFEDILKEKCTENGITYFSHSVPQNSVTVPYIEDAPNKFILRQSFDTTALVDESYCADKFGFFDLMKDSDYIPKTYFASTDLSMDTLSSVQDNSGEPNIIRKSRYPSYDGKLYPELHALETDSDLLSLKSETQDGSNLLVQEFIYDTKNISNDKWSIIRSIDIIYGGNLDVINMGGYRQTTILPLSSAPTDYVAGTRKLTQKSRYKFLNKEVAGPKIDYHTDDDTMVLSSDGTFKNIDQIKIGDYIKSIDFKDENGTGPSHDRNIEVFGWDSTLQRTKDTLEDVDSQLKGTVSAEVETIMISITLANGLTWTDAPSCTYYIVEKDSDATRFEKVNKFYVGDKLVVRNVGTGELDAIEITGLEMVYETKTIYALDFDPSDLFLVDIGDGLVGVMHNSCWCPWNYCGHWCHSNYCPGCGNTKLKL